MLCRPDGDYRPAPELKKMLIDEFIDGLESGKYVVDDMLSYKINHLHIIDNDTKVLESLPSYMVKHRISVDDKDE